ncbi:MULTISPECIES: ABC transporter ATP-binding protein [unclassified Haematospirillum]|uniref:ABC transporter ATP-binding protein n=1 Tax=unclassified Haematospirillum TaxID=2622088 RepID=UPI00143BF33B|nr:MULTISPECIES: ABC transporter ATP-binding protein [unclassified Haematospirillum]NKD55854.1 ABC transporter ATP-binding protein [Haematospirillum sp. H4890]NKD75939.1 ABC transporter ATP-binding protein [Haematospirillum sp. H4485]
MAMKSFIRLLCLAGQFRWRFVSACLLSSVAVALSLAPLLFICLAVESLSSDNTFIFWISVCVAASCLVLQPLCAGLATGIAHAAAFDTLATIRHALLRKFGCLPLDFFSSRQTGALKRLVNEDVEVLELFLSHQLPDMVSALLAPLSALVFLAVIDWRLSVAACGIVPLAITANALMMRGHSGKISQYFRLLGTINAAAVEYLQGIDALKTGGRGLRSFRVFRNHVCAFRDFAVSWQKQWLGPWAFFSVATGASLLFVVPTGMWLVLHVGVMPTTMLLAVFIATGISAPLTKLVLYGEVFLRVSKAEQAITRILEEPELTTENLHYISSISSFGFHLDAVGFQTEGEVLLRDISFEIPANQTTALVGVSGAGKTSLVRLLVRHIRPTSGHISLAGRGLDTFAPDELALCIGLINQDVFLFNDTIAANIAVGMRDASHEAILAAARAANALHFIEQLPEGFDTVIGENGVRLSGGERQRLALARALLRDAPILILDEATSHVDPVHEALIQQAVNQLAGRKTIVVVSHRLDSVSACDQIALLSDGRLDAVGTHEQLLGCSLLYSRLWALQCRNLSWSLGCPPIDGERHLGISAGTMAAS